MNFKPLFTWILARLSENSTWRGLILLLTAAGATINPDLANAIISVGLAVVGLINVFRKSYNAQDTSSSPPAPSSVTLGDGLRPPTA